MLGYAVPILLLGPPDAASSHSDVALPGLPETAACGAGWSVPGHLAQPWLESGAWVALQLENPFPDAACCLTWQQSEASPALSWLLEYLGDSETLNEEWLRTPE